MNLDMENIADCKKYVKKFVQIKGLSYRTREDYLLSQDYASYGNDQSYNVHYAD